MKELFERYYSLNEDVRSCIEKSTQQPGTPKGGVLSVEYTEKAKNTTAASQDKLFDKEAECFEWLNAKIGIASAYVPFQEDFVVMGEEKSLACGTVFPGLSMPYEKGSRI